MKKLFKSILIISIALQPLIAAAAQSTFTESLMTTGVSSAPPSIPANLLATPVSDSQINLTWDASTSGGVYPIGGYRIFRGIDFVGTTTIATTSATIYSDIGLAASTTYSYTVEAFDTNSQYSGQSSPSATTTFPVPPAPTPSPTPTSPGSGGGNPGTEFRITALRVSPGNDQAEVAFETTMPAQSRVFWGVTPDYEAGSLQSLIYGMSHDLMLTGLTSGTTYFLRIQATNSSGTTVTTDSLFTTEVPAETGPMPNPSDFRAIPETDHIALTWQNPRDPRFDSVRIVRSETFFPKDQFDGVPIYEGAAESFNDANVTVGKTYYYAIFAKSNDGQFSSGAVAKARIAFPGEVVISPTSTDPFADLPQAANVDPKIALLTLADFDFIQEGKILAQVGNQTVAVNGSENLTIRLAYAKVPEILKTIAITLADPRDPTKSFPFLLRANADRTYYQATIGPLGRSGNYAMSIAILDFENMGLKRLHGNLMALAFAAMSIPVRVPFDIGGLLALLLLVLILALLLFLLRRVFAKKTPVMTPVPVLAQQPSDDIPVFIK
jgi:fibronectin type 3 domain-containing protein